MHGGQGSGSDAFGNLLLELFGGGAGDPASQINDAWRKTVARLSRFCLTTDERSAMFDRLNAGKEKLRQDLQGREGKMNTAEEGVIVRRHLADEMEIVATALYGAARAVENKAKTAEKAGAVAPMLEPIGDPK